MNCGDCIIVFDNTENKFICCNPCCSKPLHYRVMSEHSSSQHHDYFSGVRGCLQCCIETKPGYRNRAKQESSVINCTLLALLIKIKGERVQSSDRLLGQEGCYQLLKDSRRQGRRRTGLR